MFAVCTYFREEGWCAKCSPDGVMEYTMLGRIPYYYTLREKFVHVRRPCCIPLLEVGKHVEQDRDCALKFSKILYLRFHLEQDGDCSFIESVSQSVSQSSWSESALQSRTHKNDHASRDTSDWLETRPQDGTNE